ncbi:hypothetical protein GCM10010207_84630 [Streptomyces atratus]|uniref:transposase family protein n=1 Tax=Streptomyces atratus TaxID=1893 RepID=UPI0019B6C62D|nr:transposase family protein [Streptomyces atratus]GGT74258.1 hypothetical protein GCM10010207_84630 [Streptomyces atratus]
MLRHDQRLADMADGNNVSESTARRWRDELITLLAAQAPLLDRALKKVANRGGEVVLIDVTLIPTQRRTGRADRRNYSGKHRRHGLHFLALPDERGCLIWISAARPGRTHGITAGRHEHILDHLRAAGLGALADLGFRGLDNDVLDPVIVTGYPATRAHKLTPGQKDANRVLATGRAPVEHGFAHLKNWQTLTKLRTNPDRATHLLRGKSSDRPSLQFADLVAGAGFAVTKRHDGHITPAGEDLYSVLVPLIDPAGMLSHDEPNRLAQAGAPAREDQT